MLATRLRLWSVKLALFSREKTRTSGLLSNTASAFVRGGAFLGQVLCWGVHGHSGALCGMHGCCDARVVRGAQCADVLERKVSNAKEVHNVGFAGAQVRAMLALWKPRALWSETCEVRRPSSTRSAHGTECAGNPVREQCTVLSARALWLIASAVHVPQAFRCDSHGRGACESGARGEMREYPGASARCGARRRSNV